MEGDHAKDAEDAEDAEDTLWPRHSLDSMYHMHIEGIELVCCSRGHPLLPTRL